MSDIWNEPRGQWRDPVCKECGYFEFKRVDTGGRPKYSCVNCGTLLEEEDYRGFEED